MNRLLTKIYLLPFLLLIACDAQFLDRPPLDNIGVEYYWKTAKDLENYVLQHYEYFPAHGFWYSGMPREDSNSDNLILATPNVIMNGERGVTTGRWTNDWSRIRSINIFLDNYKKCTEPYSAYKQYLGEAKFLRAWYYFDLVKRYGDVPWINTQLFPHNEEQLNRPRDPRTMVVDSILADLDQAFEHLNLRTAVGNTRINKEVALALKSRVALYEGTWQKYHANTPFGTSGADPKKYFQASVDAASKLINGSYKVGLHNNYYDLFGLDNMNNTDEVLMYRASNIADGMGNDLQYVTIYAAIEMGVTWELVSSYLGKNGEPYDYLKLASTVKGNDFLTRIAKGADPRLGQTVWIPGDLEVAASGLTFKKPGIDLVDVMLNTTGFEVKKFSNPKSPGAGKGGGGNSETGYILFRFGEVLLNYAEAQYELNQTVAYTELNRLRKRAGMPDFKVNVQSLDPNKVDYGYAIPDALYEIRRERRVELALEAHRALDYRRWAAHKLFKNNRSKGYPFNKAEFPAYNPPLDANGLIDYHKNRLPNGYQFKENRDYLDPIPNEELTLNPKLIQNPGW
jgi:hypothetical protein